MRRAWAMGACLAVLIAGRVSAQASGGADSSEGLARSVPVGRLRGSIHLDGILDEPDWAAAPAVTGLVQRDPDEGKPATERTEIRVLLGGDALYIGARLFDSDPGGIRALLARRDADSVSDRLTVMLDSRHDHLSGFVFEVNPRGVRRDGVLHADATADYLPDPVWDAGTQRDGTGWSAELRIPLSQLRFNRTDDTWGIQIKRYIQRKGEEDVLVFVSKNERDGVNRFGHLTGLTALPSGRRIEIAPYLTGRGEFTHPGAGNPFRTGSDYFKNGGGDVKIGLGNNLRLDGTFNPDFGQVEVDPAQVNLTAFETIFPEKRPFFLEGRSLFSFGQVSAWNTAGYPSVFNSRRIGRPPQRSLDGPTTAFAESPTETGIPAAVKLTGKTAAGWSVAVLEALTREEQGRILDTLGGTREMPVEPRSNYFVGRLRHESDDGNSAFGGLLTATNRDLSDSTLASQLRSSAYLGGLDFTRYWSRQSWVFDAFVTGTLLHGSPAAMTRTQQQVDRYFQRPDARHFSLDSTRTSLSGYNAVVSLTKLSGRHWLGSLTVQDKSPGYETNDLGSEGVTGRRATATDLAYTEHRPGKWLRNYRVDFFTTHEWNYDWDRVTFDIGLQQTARFKNFWQVVLFSDLFPPTTDDLLTRGGPAARTPATRSLTLQIDSDPRRRHTGGLSVQYVWSAAGDHNLTLSPSVTLNPASNLQIHLAPTLSLDYSLAQYVQTVADPTATTTYGNRYVFAALDQRTLGLETRLNWTFTRSLSLQLYAQPLVSANGFSDYKELRAPRTYSFDVYGRDKGSIGPDGSGGFTVDPDSTGPTPAFALANQSFNLRSLRANVVLRWEYRPGASLFLVWQHNRSNEADGVGSFDLGRDLGALRSSPGDNLLAVKLSYWLGL